MKNSKFKKALSDELRHEYEGFYKGSEEHIFSPEFEEEMDKLINGKRRKERFFAFLNSRHVLKYSISACTALAICVCSMALWKNHIKDHIKDMDEMVVPPTTQTTVSVPDETEPSSAEQTRPLSTDPTEKTNTDVPHSSTVTVVPSETQAESVPANGSISAVTTVSRVVVGPQTMTSRTKAPVLITKKSSVTKQSVTSKTTLIPPASHTVTTKLSTVPTKPTVSHTATSIHTKATTTDDSLGLSAGETTTRADATHPTTATIVEPKETAVTSVPEQLVTKPVQPSETRSPNTPVPVTVPRVTTERYTEMVIVTSIHEVEVTHAVTNPCCDPTPVVTQLPSGGSVCDEPGGTTAAEPHTAFPTMTVNGVTYKFNYYMTDYSFGLYRYDWSESRNLHSEVINYSEYTEIHGISGVDGGDRYLAVHFKTSDPYAFYIEA